MGKDRITAKDRNSALKELCNENFMIYIVLCFIISITPFFDKVLPHTTAVATEFMGKGKTILRDSKTKRDFVA
jgi:hypothetical protein